jgi:Bacterial self-protective colicin-like immunity
VSGQLYEFAKRFAAGEIPAEAFADPFMERWKQERDSAPDTDVRDSDEVSESLSTIFCLADLFNPEEEREEYELDESGLRSEVRKALGL